MRSVVYVLLVIAFLSSIPAHSAPYDHTFDSLSHEEQALFYPLVCNNPFKDNPDGRTCAQLPAGLYSGASKPLVAITFQTIAYGAFTKNGADEAVITFTSNLGNAANPGGIGSMLFGRAAGQWKPLGMLLSTQMSQCVPINHTSPIQVLCLDVNKSDHGTLNQDLSLLRFKMDDGTFGWDVLTHLFHADNGAVVVSQAGAAALCEDGKAGKTVLLGMRELIVPPERGISAEIKIVYGTPQKIKEACDQRRPWTAEEAGIVKFKLDQGQVVPLLPDAIQSIWPLN